MHGRASTWPRCLAPAADLSARAISRLRSWMTAQVMGAAVLTVLTVLVVRGLMAPASALSPAFASIDRDLKAGRLVGLTEAQLAARYGPAGRDEQGLLTYRTGRKVGRVLDGRLPEFLFIRIEDGVVVEAGLERRSVAAPL